MAHLTGGRVFLGAGLAVLAWRGGPGDSHASQTDQLVRRAEYASSSIICRGAFQMTEYPEGSGPWPIVLPGQMCNDVLGDFTPGKYTWSALEEDSFELCAGAIDSYGQQDMGSFVAEARGRGAFTIPTASILIVATGTVRAKGKNLPAPTIVHAKGAAIEVELVGQGMWMKRL